MELRQPGINLGFSYGRELASFVFLGVGVVSADIIKSRRLTVQLLF